MGKRDVLQFLDLVWGEEEGWVSLPYKSEGSWHERKPFYWPEERELVSDYVGEKLQEKVDLYFLPLILDQPRRKAANLKNTHWCWADLDTADPRTIRPRPTVAWESSNGRYQALWRIRSDVDPGVASDLSRKLAFHVGADPSGWDLTQVLRPVGSFNFKYDRPYGVELLWSDGRTYSRRRLAATLKDVEVPEDTEEMHATPELPSDSPGSIIRRYKQTLSGRAMSLIRTRESQTEGQDRSLKIRELCCLLAEAGMKPGEIVVVVQQTAWNKFAGRADETTRLWIEAQKAIRDVDNTQSTIEVSENWETKTKPRLVDFATLMMQPFSRPKWLIEDWWAEQSHGIIGGEPKTYKSVIGTDMCLSIAAGVPCLGQFKPRLTGPVLMIQEENTPWILADRLMKVTHSMGLLKAPELRGEKILIEFPKDYPLYFLNNYGFNLTDSEDRTWLEETISRLKPVMVMFDPLYLMLGDVDENNTKELRPVLRWLLSLRYRYGCAIPVISHFRKQEADRGGQRIAGSHLLHAWVESAVYCDIPQAEDPTLIQIEREQRSFPKRPSLNVRFELGEPGDPQYDISIGAVPPEVERINRLQAELQAGVKTTSELYDIFGKLGVQERVTRRMLKKLEEQKRIISTGSGRKISYEWVQT